MVVWAKRLLAAALVGSTTWAMGAAAYGQTANPQGIDLNDYPTVQEAFEDTFFTEIGDRYRNNGILGDLRDLVGVFPENSMVRDAARVNELYWEVLRIQTTSDPTIRTADLATPFDSSLATIRPYTPPVPTPAVYVPPAVRSVPSGPPVGVTPPVRGLY